MAGWREQWDRVGRWLERVRQVCEGREGGTPDARDDVYVCFQSIHHMKDWLGNDPASGVARADVDQLINGSRALQLSADLANGSKHSLLTSTRTGDPSTGMVKNDVNIMPGPRTVASHRFYVASGGTEYDALEVAEEAVRELDAFLRSNGLL